MSGVEVPVFKADNYEKYKYQVEMWAKVCGLEKMKQAPILWLDPPNDHLSNIKIKFIKK